ncbi:hypothetical protein QQ045_006569 [Rhodiola kirilowii]
MSQLPWLLLGDFNEILKFSKTTGNAYRRKSFISQFQIVIQDCSLSHLGYKGVPYTYSNKRRCNYEVRCRLDRAFASSDWRSFFPTASVTHLVVHHSDHCSVLLKLEHHQVCSHKPFRKIDSRFWQANINKEKFLIGELDEWLHREELIWCQRARITWLTEGDQITRYFHERPSVRNRTNRISSLKRSDGSFTSDLSLIHQEAVQYFMNLFESQSNISKVNLRDMLAVVPTKVTSDHNVLLLAPYTADKITNAIFQLHPTKAPGIDGFPALFYQKFWNSIKDHFIHTCLQFLNHGILEEHINDTLIILIPKQKLQTSWSSIDQSASVEF